MKAFAVSLIVGIGALLLQGCVTTVGIDTDNSFGARASRGVRAAMTHEMCPHGASKSTATVGSRIQISSDSAARYREDVVQVREEYSGQRTDNCAPAPVKSK
jgi:hypothetical protein